MKEKTRTQREEHLRSFVTKAYVLPNALHVTLQIMLFLEHAPLARRNDPHQVKMKRS